MTCRCGCGGESGCGSRLATTPLAIDNRPGQPSLAARIGTFSSFRRTMLEAIGVHGELGQLTTRDPDDGSISLVEQAAAIGDVLTFYTERYANESYLGTAVSDVDVRRLVGLIGYRPAPGVSATTTLSVTLDEGKAFTVPAGFGVQSVPGPGEKPQDFETLVDLDADARLNALPARPAQASAHPLGSALGSFAYAPDAALLARSIQVGEQVLLVRAGAPGALVTTKVDAITVERERLRVRFGAQLSGSDARAFRVRRSLRLFGHDAPDGAPPAAVPDATVPGGVRWTFGGSTDYSLAAGDTLTLDRVYDDLPVGATLVVSAAGWTGLLTVKASTQVYAEIGTSGAAGRNVKSGPATRLTFTTALPALGDRRLVTVAELGDELRVAKTTDHDLESEVWVPGTAAAADDGSSGLVVATAVTSSRTSSGALLLPADLARGRAVILADGAGHAVSTAVRGECRLEPPTSAVGQPCFLVVPLAATTDDLARLDRGSLVLLGNAVPASHGKTVTDEVAGSADAAVPFQRFALAKSPLTRVPAATPAGVAPALTLRVGGLAWTTVDGLLAAGPRDEFVALRTGDDDHTVVVFGDGEHGERPPTGTSNVVATYRFGAGLAGRVRAGTLTNAASRPPGLRGVVNPGAAEGGADPEHPDRMRERAPRSVRVFGRAVSAADYADLLVSNGTVAKAQSAELWNGHGLVIAVSVAGPDMGTFSPSGLATLAATDKSAASPYRRVVVGNAVAVAVRIAMNVAIQTRADSETVLADVRAAVRALFAFEVVSLGGHLPLSEIYRVAQPVSGVEAVTVVGYGFARPVTATDPAWAAFLDDHGDTGEATPEWLRFLRVRLSDGLIAHAELPALADVDLVISAVSSPPVIAGGLA